MDTFETDLAQEPERLIDERFPDPRGGTYWPHLVYARPDGARPLMLDLRVPEGAAARPLVVYIHGGGWRIGTPKYDNPTLRRIDAPGRLHAAGFAVARISYRLSGEATWPVPLHDCKAAIRWLRARADTFGVDPRRVAVMGESAGGHLAAMVALTGDDPEMEGAVGETGGSTRVAAAVNWYGVTDLWSIGERREPPPDGAPRMEEALIGGPRAANRTALEAASPVRTVGAAAPPFLHQHGDADRIVPHSQAEALHAALKEAGHDTILDLVPGADHCFWGAAPADRDGGIMDRAIAFLGAHLGHAAPG
ncbi:alpha/beta hydrolase [Wenxinia saemankumensis]|uniref:Acetyl esterase/lipase n=1 Tax=Wenxinia saemankumensis TaxID=1447782 RepID=A0A1M6AMS0_9RHOB|nr:alpha/beta hydrolase [Wenxinia saemankumensis]SHI37786.1 Acetyl esterase/lipase [Wenxinia saemankumensis]